MQKSALCACVCVCVGGCVHACARCVRTRMCVCVDGLEMRKELDLSRFGLRHLCVRFP